MLLPRALSLWQSSPNSLLWRRETESKFGGQVSPLGAELSSAEVRLGSIL